MQTARIEDPLEAALLLAASAGRFDVVSQLAKELEARRLAGSNVAHITTSKEAVIEALERRAELEALAGPLASVTSLASRTPKR